MNHSKTNRGTGGGHRRARGELASEDSYRKSKTNNHICSRRRDATRPRRKEVVLTNVGKVALSLLPFLPPNLSTHRIRTACFFELKQFPLYGEYFKYF